MNDPRRAAYLSAYALLEAVQGDDHRGAAAEVSLAAERAARAGWSEVGFVLAAAEVVHQIARPSGTPPSAGALDALLGRAEDLESPAFMAMALGLRALDAAASGDTAQLLSDAARAVALLDDEEQPPLDRCTAYVVTAASLNTLRLWELVDDLYSRAAELGPLCDAPAQAAAVATNRVLIRLEWALALLENGDERATELQLGRVEQVLPAAMAEALPLLWRRNIEASAEVVMLLRGEDPTTRAGSVAVHRAALIQDGDRELLPILEAATTWALWRHGHHGAAAAAAGGLAFVLSSTSSGARSFPLWVRATVLADISPSAATEAQHDHVTLVTRLLWESRTAVLAAARAQIDVERRRAEHAGLTQAVHTDPLTGLQNRRSFDAWLQGGSRRPHQATALLLIDLDGFKRINDTYGHECGDQVLRRVGELMRSTIRADDVAIRHGGDEFAVLLSDEHLSPDVARQRARELRETIVGWAWTGVAPGLVVSVTIGIAVSAGAHGDHHGRWADPVEIYRAADRALYAAKNNRSGMVLTEVSPVWSAMAAPTDESPAPSATQPSESTRPDSRPAA
jgi:diguanylate cyclase (GGDEF)-like protein